MSNNPLLQAVYTGLHHLSEIIWGPLMVVLLLGVGIYLMVGLRAMPWLRLGQAFRMLKQRPIGGEDHVGDISPFQALMTALSGAVGTGNIAGVATAITLGGPGAVFWMWIVALVGMATMYCEAVLAVHYREINALGNYVGGPMYYIRNGLGRRWHWLGMAFSIFAMVAAFGIGNTVQANSVADAVHASLDLPSWLTGVVIAILSGAVIIGGINRIGEVAARLVPLMALIYVGGALWVIFMHIGDVPAVLILILEDAFSGTSATGGFAGATVWMGLRYGLARGIFSNEAGLGSTPIAHAAAITNSPVRQGMIGMLGTFIDTLIVCSMTAFVILLTGTWISGETGAALSAEAFEKALPGIGNMVVSFSLIVFALSTILAWSYYGERCAEFVFGAYAIRPYRLLWILAIPVGAAGNLGLIWLVADVLNGLMAIPNLIALAALSPVVFRLTRRYRFLPLRSRHGLPHPSR